MKILLTAINAKFIHSSLAIRYLYVNSGDLKEYITKKEYTINNSEDFILTDIFSQKPEIICFSCYIWNIGMITSLSENIKKVLPKTKIILGGPEVSYDSYTFLEENKDIDIIIRGEGEETFKELISALKNNTNAPLDNIEGITYRDGLKICENSQRAPLNLNTLWFPYETLEDLENRIIYYETQRGCPFNCRFCLSSVEKGVRFVNLDIVYKQLDFFLKERVRQVKFVDRSFNCSKVHSKSIWKYLIENSNGFTNFHMEIEAHLIDDETIEILKMAEPGLFQFEIGIQSTNVETLNAVERDADFEDLKERVLQIKELNNIHVHLDLIAGLPKENYLSFKKSFNDVFQLKPEQLQLGFLKVLKGSGLKEDKEKYNIQYRSNAPYEVLFTEDITFEEMIKLKNIEEMVEIYYNSGKAINVLNFIIPKFSDSFTFFESLSEFWIEKEHHKVNHTRAKTYEILRDFLIEHSTTKDFKTEINNYLKLDMLIFDNLPNLPQWAELNKDKEDLKRIKREFFNNTEKREEYLKDFSDYTPTQIGRMCRLENFDFNVLESNAEMKETFILLNYKNRNILNNQVMPVIVEV